MNTDVVTEVPTSLKRLIRMVMKGFYPVEHAIVMDILIRHPCIKEDDLVDLLKFERKQLRTVVNQLKNEHFVHARLRMETGADGKATRQNYYYVRYKAFVNVVKYKLDIMRRKIETEERDSTSRASFKCSECQKTYTDLEADRLCDFATGEFRCSFCSAPLNEDESAMPRTDSRMMLARFNSQMEPLFKLLREVDDVKLSQDILEPEPTDMTQIKKDAGGSKSREYQSHQVQGGDHNAWSGDATRNKNYQLNNEQGITINFGGEDASNHKAIQEEKEQPIWMLESTVKKEKEYSDFQRKQDDFYSSLSAADTSSANHNQVDIMEALLAHERQTAADPQPVIPGQVNNEESYSSESEDSMKPTQASLGTAVPEMESEDEDTLLVTIGDLKVPVNEVTEDHIARMTTSEKDTYIRLTQDLYAQMYE